MSSSNRRSFALGALVGAASGAALVAAALLRGAAAPPAPPPAAPSVAADASSDEELAILTEQLSRNRSFFGDVAQARVERASVVVVGVGGVGSHAAHMLARSGVARLRLIDFDLVSLSTLNRHATAVRRDVGTPKVDALARAIRAFAPRCVVEPIAALFTASAAPSLLSGPIDFVLDCIDDRTTKAALLLHCAQHSIRVLSSLGAGGKADPTRLVLTDLALVRGDPLGVALKLDLRKAGLFAAQNRERGGSGTAAAPAAAAADTAAPPLLSGIRCLSSTEEPRVDLLPLPPAEEGSSGNGGVSGGVAPEMCARDLGAGLEGFRVRVMPVLGTMPALFGASMAADVLCALAGVEHEVSASARETAASPPGLISRFTLAFTRYEETTYPRGPGWGAHTSLSAGDGAFILDDVWRGRSPVCARRVGVRGVTLQLVRWRPWAPSSVSNIVLLTDDEAMELQGAAREACVYDLARDAIAAGADLGGGAQSGGTVEAAALEAAWARAVEDLWPAPAIALIRARLSWARGLGWR